MARSTATANTGSIYRHQEKWRAKITVGDSRPSFALTPQVESEARARARHMADAAALLDERCIDVRAVLKAMGKAPTEGFAERIVEAALRRQREIPQPRGMTVEQLGKAWTSGEISKRYPDHVKRLARGGDTARILVAYVYPVIGSVEVASITLDHLDRVASNLPPHLSSGTRSLALRRLARLVRIAVYPMRLLAHDPIPRGWVPASKYGVFPYLYPMEEAALLGCLEVPLERRVLYGLTAREGMRKSEVLGLRWTDIDLDLGTISLTKTKTNEPRTWKLGADSLAAMRLWREMVKGPKVFSLPMMVDQSLRPDLLTAGVDRKDLHKPQSPRKPIRFHDLRATFVTLALAVGKPERWVMARTGHTTSGMLSRYHRQARLAEELDQGWLADMVESIPEFRGTNSSGSGQSSVLPSNGNGASGEKTRNSNGLQETEIPLDESTRQHLATSNGDNFEDFDHRTVWEVPERVYSGRQIGHQKEAPEQSSSDLHHALLVAAQAGEWEVVKRLLLVIEGDSFLASPKGVPEKK